MVGEFKAFLLKTNALALAVGVIIGAALGAVVTSLVEDILMPPIGMLLGKVNFNELKIVLQAAAGDTPEVAIRYGAFINSIVAFIIVVFVVWQIGRTFIKEAPEPAPAPSKTCPYCREANAVEASKCRACASAI